MSLSSNATFIEQSEMGQLRPKQTKIIHQDGVLLYIAQEHTALLAGDSIQPQPIEQNPGYPNR
jgi:hypothetical protein